MLVLLNRAATASEIDDLCRWIGRHGAHATLIPGEPSVIETGNGFSPEQRRELVSLSGVAGLAGAPDAAPVTSNLRIAGIRPLVPPAILMEQLPLRGSAAMLVHRSRSDISRILRHEDDRLVVVVGPCSIHDPEAALSYAQLLAGAARLLQDDLLIVMRVYFEKPRTTVGWKGLINDPELDGSFAVNSGLHIARKLLLDVIELGLPAGCEFLDPVSPQFIADAVSWAAIGARTTESQVHRNLASGLSMPVGFKNGTGGGIQMALDAISAASYPHQFMSVTEQGLAAIVETRGNHDTHVILRGGNRGPNYDAESIGATLSLLEKGGLPARVMVDASHGNSDKDYRKQPEVIASVSDQVAGGQRGIIGVMLESFIEDGRQELVDRDQLVFGKSITDACMGWPMTEAVLEQLAESVKARRLN